MSLKYFAVAAALASTFLLSGCNDQKSDSTTTESTQTTPLRVGVIAGSEQALAEFVQQQAKEKYNLDVELVTFNDYVTPNQALSDKLIDINQFQHKPFLDAQMQDRGYKLAVVGKTFVYPFAAYSKKIKPMVGESSEAGVKVISPRGETYLIPDNATIAIPNDPTNLGRALLLLQQQKLLNVDPNKGLLPTVMDITNNPHNFKILELDPPQLPQALNDPQVDLAIINTAYSSQIGLTAIKDGVFAENKDTPYVNIIVAREDNKDDPRIATYLKAYQSDAVAKKAEEVFKGSAVKGW